MGEEADDEARDKLSLPVRLYRLQIGQVRAGSRVESATGFCRQEIYYCSRCLSVTTSSTVTDAMLEERHLLGTC